jgi:hypothetical protein
MASLVHLPKPLDLILEAVKVEPKPLKTEPLAHMRCHIGRHEDRAVV